LNFPEIPIGSKVRIYDDKKKSHHEGIVKKQDEFEISLEDGTSYRKFEFRYGLSIVIIDSEQYENAIKSHVIETAIGVLNRRDYAKHPKIVELLNECMKELGEDTVNKRIRMMECMGALIPLEERIKREACLKVT
jgi:hypothetical protein